MTAVCPQCGKDDRVQKVSFLYEHGITHIEGSGTTEPSMREILFSDKPQPQVTVRVKETTQTSLSKKLSPPKKMWWTLGCLFLSIMGVYPGILCLIATFFVAISRTSIPSFLEDNWFIPIATVVIGTAIGFVLETQSAPRDKKAIAMWNRLYYCSRDDCVFDPTTGASAPLDNIKSLLYSNVVSQVPSPTSPAVRPPGTGGTPRMRRPEVQSLPKTQSTAKQVDSDTGTVEQRLRKLKQLFAEGLITEDEFNRKRDEILREL